MVPKRPVGAFSPQFQRFGVIGTGDEVLGATGFSGVTGVPIFMCTRWFVQPKVKPNGAGDDTGVSMFGGVGGQTSCHTLRAGAAAAQMSPKPQPEGPEPPESQKM